MREWQHDVFTEFHSYSAIAVKQAGDKEKRDIDEKSERLGALDEKCSGVAGIFDSIV